MKTYRKPKKVRAAREHEERENRQRYRNWEAVLAEGTWIACCRCGWRQYVRGDLTIKRCRRCGARLGVVGI
jgi:hypothetical protein